MDSSARLRHYINDNGPLILDGGLATELEAHGAVLQVKYKQKHPLFVVYLLITIT